MEMHTFIANLEAGVRTEELDGRRYLVAPAVMMVEGVHTGNKGPVFYSGAELDKSAPAWNHKPVVVSHPKVGQNFTSAADKTVIMNQQVGFLLNTNYTAGKLRTEAWIDEQKCLAVEPRLLENVRAGKVTEVSTGLYSDENLVANGDYNGTRYGFAAVNHRPDHLAILMDQPGACSIEKGAGLLANEASLSEIQSLVASALYDKFRQPGYSWNGWIEDVFETQVVYYAGGDLYALGYSIKDGQVSFTGEPVAVVRHVSYRSASGTVVGNAAGGFVSLKELSMKTKKEKVDSLIANGGWTEADREWLMTQDDARIDRMAPKAPAVIANTNPVPQPQPAPARTLTVNEFLAQAPPELAGFLQESVEVAKAQKDALIANIMGCPSNTFTKEWLEHQAGQRDGMKVLQGLARMAAAGVVQGACPAPTVLANGAPGIPVLQAPQAPLNMHGNWMPTPIVNAYNAAQTEIASAPLATPGQE